MEFLARDGLAAGGKAEGRVGPRFRRLFLQERECGLIGRMPSVGAPVRMPQPVGKILPLHGAGDLAGRSGGASDVGDVGEIVLGGSAITPPGKQPSARSSSSVSPLANSSSSETEESSKTS